jgi:hypothetical protein
MNLNLNTKGGWRMWGEGVTVDFFEMELPYNGATIQCNTMPFPVPFVCNVMLLYKIYLKDSSINTSFLMQQLIPGLIIPGKNRNTKSQANCGFEFTDGPA